MNLLFVNYNRALSLHAAARRLHMPERTLRYRASRGLIPGAFKQGKLWKFPLLALESAKQADTQRLPSGQSCDAPGGITWLPPAVPLKKGLEKLL